MIPVAQAEALRETWAILVEAAARGTTLTYGQLAARLARPGYRPLARSMQGLLNPIMDYCDARILPRRNDLVVNQKTRRPSYAAPGYDHEASQRRVFAYDWATVVVDEDDLARR